MCNNVNYKLSAEPLVSVVIANYNSGDKLLRAVKSILKQTYRNLECIVVDDCSTDDSVNSLDSIDDDRLVILKLEKNVGSFVAANEGLEKAKGELIARLDADDWSFPNRIKYQVDVFKNNSALILLAGKSVRVDEENNYYEVIGFENDPFSAFALMLTQNLLTHSTVMFRSHYPDGRKIKYRTGRVACDYFLGMDLMLEGEIRIVDMFFGVWQNSSTNITAIHNDKQKQVSRQAKMEMVSRVDYSSPFVRKAIIRELALHLEDREAGWRFLDNLLKYLKPEDWSDFNLDRIKYKRIEKSEYPNKKKILYSYCKSSPFKHTTVLTAQFAISKVMEKLKLGQNI